MRAYREARIEIGKVQLSSAIAVDFDAKAANDLLSVGMLQLPPELAKPEAATWTIVGQALLNLSETIMRN